jgi:peptidoglycan/LPS O-acetylase OafA/YrhL
MLRIASLRMDLIMTEPTSGNITTLTSAQSTLLDASRYMAAFMVLCSHAFAHFYAITYQPYRQTYHTNLGSLGISIFFLLSGFLIAYTIIRKRHRRPEYGFSEYMVERFVRIYIVFAPVLFLMLAIRVVAALANISPAGHPLGTEGLTDMFTARHFFGTLFMLQGVRGIFAPGETFSLVPPAWSLNYEFMYYIAYGGLALGALWQGNARTRLLSLMLIGASFVVMSRLSNIWPLTYNWLAGAAMAIAFTKGVLPRSRASNVIIALALALAYVAALIVYGNSLPRWVTVTFMALEMYALLGAIKSLRLPLWLERASYVFASFSYSMYLLHFAAIYIAYAVCEKLGLLGRFPEGDALRFVFVVGLIVAINFGSFAFSLLTERNTNRVRVYVKHRLALLAGR